MAVNDTISDMLTRIRNAGLARHETTKVPATKVTRCIAAVLKAEGFIGEYEESSEGIEKNIDGNVCNFDTYKSLGFVLCSQFYKGDSTNGINGNNNGQHNNQAFFSWKTHGIYQWCSS